ncbi:MAG TPA: acyltransferase [Longimicrobiales bacterium]
MMRPELAGPGAGQADERRYDLDWLRVSAFLLLIFYHVGMFFVPWDWHLKNPRTAGPSLEIPMFLVSRWRLPLLFVVSGAAVHFALRKRSRTEFVRERFSRLLVPLIFSMLVVVPPQVYYERVAEGAAYTSFLAFLPDAFAGGAYPRGNISWHHLWFVAYVFVYALLALPLFHALRSDRGRAVVGRFAAWCQRRPSTLFLFALPILASEIALRPAWPATHNLVADWANFVTYLILFVYGYVLYSDERFGAAIERRRRAALMLGIAASASLVTIARTGHSPDETAYDFASLAWIAANALDAGFWLVALMGYARRYLNVRSTTIRYANEAVYPFYILHQTVIIAIAYHLIDWDVAIPLKFAVIATGTFVVTTALYLAIRTNDVTRVLFGMKRRAAAARASATRPPAIQATTMRPSPARARPSRAPETRVVGPTATG